ncbi:MAG: exonuclease domain-containing protein, partial [Bacillota bacterium]|nr:exonuclease domain-containing protein [Bacillota bacterium]
GHTEEFQTLVDPGISLPSVITELTGITDEMLEGQPSIEDVIPDFLDFIGDAVPIAHNASFEAGFLRPYLGLENEEWLDTITLAKIAFPTLGSYSLANIVTSLELTNEAPHRALADARATTLLFQAAEKKFAAMDKGVIASLIEILAPSYPVYGDYFQRFDPDTLAPRFLPPYNKIEKIEDVVPGDEAYEINLKKLRDYLEGSEGLGSLIEDYQPREPQIQMAEKVGEAFNSGSFLLAEAGTGTGKTIAYLLPAAMVSLEGGFRVVLSTHTIHLQDQIINKDIPDINRLFHHQLKTSLVKGRNHYLCYRKWSAAFADPEKDNAVFLTHLLPWVVETEDGDGDFLNLNSRERREWQKFSAAGDTCRRGHCPYYRSKCFVHRIRRKAEQSHLVVINHSLLLTDSMTAGGTLPSSDYLVIDEAHQLDKVAEENLGYTFNYFDHVSLHNEIRRSLQKLLKMAAFPGLFSKEEELEAMKERQNYLKNLLADFDDRVVKGDEMFIALKQCYYQFHQSRNPVSKTWRIDSRVREAPLWRETETYLENYHLNLTELTKALKRLSMEFEDELNDDGNEKEKYQLSYLMCRLEEGLNAVYYFLRGESENMVAWLEEGSERMLYPILRLAPVKVNEILAENLFAAKESIVFVSATLSV